MLFAALALALLAATASRADLDCTSSALQLAPLQTGFINTNVLTITVNEPTVTGRTLTSLAIGTCNFPAASVAGTCAVGTAGAGFVSTGAFSWSDLTSSTCGSPMVLVGDNDPDTLTYVGKVTAVYTELTGDVFGAPLTRTVTQEMPLKVQFDRHVDTPQVVDQVYTVPTAEGDITAITVSVVITVATGAIAPTVTVQMTLATPLPFVLTVGDVAVVDADQISNLVQPSGLVATTGPDTTHNYWTLTFTFTTDRCTLSLSASVAATVGCNGGASATCPFPTGSAAPITLSYPIVLAGLCGDVVDSVSSTATGATYRSTSWDAASAFFVGDTVYFRADVSVTATKATISSASITQISCTGAAVQSPPLTLMSPWTASGTPTLGTTAQTYVAFQLASTSFQGPASGSDALNLVATVSITYTGNSRRDVQTTELYVPFKAEVGGLRSGAASCLSPWF